MSIVRTDGLRLERPVTMDDMREVHAGGKFGMKRRFCLDCANSMLVTRHEKHGAGVAGYIGARGTSRTMRPVQEPCRAGMRQFIVEVHGRVAEGPHGETWWASGCAPEQWAFLNLWVEERMEWAHWMDFRQQSSILGKIWHHQQLQQLAEAEKKVRSEIAAEKLKEFYAPSVQEICAAVGQWMERAQ